MNPPRITSTYSFREVKNLVRSAYSMSEHKDSKGVHVKLIDLSLALEALRAENEDEARAIYLCGVYQVDFRDAEGILHFPRSTISDRYTSGIRKLTRILNGESY